nr:unnamed protein product [Spirometra erinaceieuropaei]
MTGATIYEVTTTTAAKVKRKARKSQLPPPRNVNAQPPPTCPRCRRTFRAQIGLIGHLRTNCSTQATQPDVPPVRLCFVSRPAIKTDHTPEPPQSSSSTASISTATAPAPTATALNPNKPTNINLNTAKTRDVDSVHTCPHCDRTFIPHIGLVGHLRIPRTETVKPVPGAPTYTHLTRLHCPHCPRTFTHRMGLLGHMRVHESDIDRRPDSPTTPNPTPDSSPCAPTTLSATDIDFTCPRCPRTFTSRIGLVGHLRIHRTETGEPVPGAPTYTHLNPHSHPLPPPQYRLRRLLHPPPLHSIQTPRQTSTSPPSIPVLIAIAPSPHTSPWLVICESIAQRLANQGLDQHTSGATASTAITAPAYSPTA